MSSLDFGYDNLDGNVSLQIAFGRVSKFQFLQLFEERWDGASNHSLNWEGSL